MVRIARSIVGDRTPDKQVELLGNWMLLARGGDRPTSLVMDRAFA
jgi:hypothetical protein